MDGINGIVFLGVIKYLTVLVFVLFTIFGGEPDLVDGIVYWLSDGALK